MVIKDKKAFIALIIVEITAIALGFMLARALGNEVTVKVAPSPEYKLTCHVTAQNISHVKTVPPCAPEQR